MGEHTFTTDEMKHCLQMVAAVGCEQSYRRLFRWFYGPLQQFAFAIVKSREMAEEIAADVLVNIWRNRQQLPDIDHLKIYLYTAAKNISLNYLRKQNRHAVISLDNMEMVLTPLNNNPEQLFITAELLNRLEQTINQLPPRCRLIFKLVREDGLKYKEIAAILDISVNTIDAQMAIAFKKISQAVNLNMSRRQSVK
ncbi:RNA polymerase sigma-70 factor [Chitinophaga sp. 22321]|uniref:RNA polymerase sigma-70 factor n=1 Tax=Chitinophaga hostae TaxID=2831022 RepID=A0ABS5JBC4_9BACT|nr:RNA polymerase sigma-70 factor [Chitinophaga hostae]MBS0032365.1 RNA polymerase sigma-70 factor [Chitinophaga hostae]